jgi:RecG-like helicase
MGKSEYTDGPVDQPPLGAGGGDAEWTAAGHWSWLLPVPVVELAGVGVRRAAALGHFGVSMVGQLLLRLPRRYIDRSLTVAISEAPIGEEVTLVVQVLDRGQSATGRSRSFRGRAPARVRVGDGSSELDCVWFHGHPQALPEGEVIAISGKIEQFGGRLQIVHPEIEPLGESETSTGDAPRMIHTGTIVPVYGSGEELKAAGLSSRRWRSLVRTALDCFASRIEENISDDIRNSLSLVVYGKAFMPFIRRPR